jgi:DNA mismatch endonuclease, patch repair protein
LHAAGMRFRKDYRVRAGPRWVRPDVVFIRAKLAVFMDGCFWHGCPEHGSVPAANADYWASKLRQNVERDRAIDSALVADGWTVLRVWEHEVVSDVDRAVELVSAALNGREVLGEWEAARVVLLGV